MKKLLLFLFIFSNKFNSFCQNVTNQEVNKILENIKGAQYDFGTYSLNNFPCSTCSGGWYSHSKGDNQEAIYAYSNKSFKGQLINPYLQYIEKRDELFLTFKWVNTSKNGGFSEAMIRYEFNLSAKESSWNTLIRFQAMSTEMVAYIYLNSKELNSIKENLLSTKYYGNYLIEQKNKEIEISRKKKQEDSIKAMIQFEELRKNQIKDSIIYLEKRKSFVNDSIFRRSLNLGDNYLNGIVVKIDETGHGLIISQNELFMNAPEAVRMLSKKNDNWRIPLVKEMQEIIKLTKEDNRLDKILEKTQYYGNTYGWGNAKWWFALSEKGAILNLDNLWWVFKSSISKDQPVKSNYRSSQTVDKTFARIRLVKDF